MWFGNYDRLSPAMLGQFYQRGPRRRFTRGSAGTLIGCGTTTIIGFRGALEMMRLRSRIRVAKRLRTRHGIWPALVDRDLASRALTAIFYFRLATGSLTLILLVEAEVSRAAPNTHRPPAQPSDWLSMAGAGRLWRSS